MLRGQNFRLNQLTGAVAGTDTTINAANGIAAAAYHRNDVNAATPTTLFMIDAISDRLYLQGGVNGTPAPNGGVLTLIGALGVDTDSFAGFDFPARAVNW